MLDNGGGRHLGRMGDNGVVLVVEVEDDQEHYLGRVPGPGSRSITYQCRD
jgi:hypothetical protein